MTDEKNDQNQTSKVSSTEPKRERIPIWKKITLAGIIGAIGAISLVVTQLDKIIDVYEKRIGPKPPVVSIPHPVVPTPPTPVTTLAEACETLQVKPFPVFPYYLVNTYNNTPYKNKYIYWASLSGKNTCDQRLQIKVWLKPDPLKATVDREEFSYTVESREEITDRTFPILLKIITKSDENFKIKGDWKIYALSDSAVNRVLRQRPLEISMIAENQVYWDLRDPDDRPVDVGFLLASLSAWSILPKKPPPDIGELNRKYLLQAGNPEDWLRNCYMDLFRSDAPVRVHRFTDPWPLRGHGLNSQQRIRTSEMVLAGKKADSLEAALLIAALKYAASEDVKIRLVLFALPVDPEKDEGEKRFLLAWSPQKGEWRAIDLTAPNDLDFDRNAQQASVMLAKFLEGQGDKIFSLLNTKGVFYDENRPLAQQSLLALDFRIASGTYAIAGLPQE